jgi:hypothetical protein
MCTIYGHREILEPSEACAPANCGSIKQGCKTRMYSLIIEDFLSLCPQFLGRAGETPIALALLSQQKRMIVKDFVSIHCSQGNRHCSPIQGNRSVLADENKTAACSEFHCIIRKLITVISNVVCAAASYKYSQRLRFCALRMPLWPRYRGCRARTAPAEHCVVRNSCMVRDIDMCVSSSSKPPQLSRSYCWYYHAMIPRNNQESDRISRVSALCFSLFSRVLNVKHNTSGER